MPDLRRLGVASLNVAGLPGRLPPIADRAVEICRFLEASELQVVNLQEVRTRHYLEIFRRLLPSYEFVAYAKGLTGYPRGGVVTFSRLPLGAIRFASFRRSRVGSGALRFRIGKRLNSAWHGVLTVELPTIGAVLGNVHLTSNREGDWSATNRHFLLQRSQLLLLHRALARARVVSGAQWALVSGDFNVASNGPLYPRIVDDGAWRDPFAATDPVTFQVEYLPAGAAAHRIDYLLIAGDEQRYPVIDSEVLFEQPVQLSNGQVAHLSDHLGISCRIALPNPA